MVVDFDVVAFAPQENEVGVAGNRLGHCSVVRRADELRFWKNVGQELHEIALPPLVKMKIDLVDTGHRRFGQHVRVIPVIVPG